MVGSSAEVPQAFFAPAGRAAPAELAASRGAFSAAVLAAELLEAFPGLSFVLNGRRQILGANRRTLAALGLASIEPILGRRPGEVIECVHAEAAPEGCGAASACQHCGALNAVLECIASRRSAGRECRIRTRGGSDGGAMDFRVDATHVEVAGEPFIVVALTDISAEKRRRVLERLFCHDLLNTVGAIQGISQLLLDGEDRDGELGYLHDLHQLAAEAADEIDTHREMMAAERGELTTRVESFPLDGLLEELASSYRHHSVAKDRHVRAATGSGRELVTDRTLLRRILGNLLKNALEATSAGGTVSIESRADEHGGTIICVNNPGTMPEWVQAQVFQRSFSTKASSGRGIGTYSVQLFTERYLGGRVAFETSETAGTTFSVALP